MTCVEWLSVVKDQGTTTFNTCVNIFDRWQHLRSSLKFYK